MAVQQSSTRLWTYDRCAVIVAHPDDETLWAGGTILLHPECKWTIVSICRKSDQDRSEKYFRALEQLGATGAIGDLDDGPDQRPLPAREVQQTILELLDTNRFDLILTHAIWGEYTRHLRHEETAKAVIALRDSGELVCKEMRMFAYEDGRGQYLPRAVRDADVSVKLPEDIWQKKYQIITQTYGFAPDSFEAKTTPRQESFWVLRPGQKYKK